MTRRLLFGLLGFAALLLVLLVVPLGVANQRSERSDLSRRLERDAVAASSLASDLLRDGSTSKAARTQLDDRLASYAKDSGARVVVVDADGTSVLDTGEPGRKVELGRDFTTRPEVASALEGQVDSGERGSDTLGHPLLFVAVPVSSGGTSLGAVRLSYPAHELDRRITNYWTGLGAVALAVLAVAALVGAFVARWIARPLEGIAQVAHDVGAGDLAARADEHDGPPEVRAVAARLNDSVAALDRMIEEQRAFTADASHQLRTPLHALTLRLDNVAHELEDGDIEAASADVDKAVAELERLASLVELLLVLQRADRLVELPTDPIDLVDVVGARSDDWTTRAARTEVAIELDLPPTLPALANSVHVEQVLDNLVDNAITASPAGRPIRVVGRESGDAVELHVVDQGAGLDDDELEQAFRRFHSGSERPARGRSGGFGLGLSIVQRLVEADGGTVELRHGPGRGIDAVVRYRSVRPTEGSDPQDRRPATR